MRENTPTNGHPDASPMTTPTDTTRADSAPADAYSVGDRVFTHVIHSAKPEPLSDENRGSWYCPCATPLHEQLIRHLLSHHNFSTVYDLGAGDLRLAAALADDYHVVAYETNEYLAETAYEMHNEPDIDLRTRDYYADWDTITTDDAVIACIGTTNKLPDRPTRGVGIHGSDDITIIPGDTYINTNNTTSHS